MSWDALIDDLEIQNHGSLFLLHARSAAGADWIDEHLPKDAQVVGEAVIVEHRFIDAIATGAVADGLVVTGSN
jgi:hypothetical protein